MIDCCNPPPPHNKGRLITSNRDVIIDVKISLSSVVGSWSKRQVVGLGEDNSERERLIRISLSRQLPALILSESNVELDCVELEMTEVRYC